MDETQTDCVLRPNLVGAFASALLAAWMAAIMVPLSIFADDTPVASYGVMTAAVMATIALGCTAILILRHLLPAWSFLPRRGKPRPVAAEPSSETSPPEVAPFSVAVAEIEASWRRSATEWLDKRDLPEPLQSPDAAVIGEESSHDGENPARDADLPTGNLAQDGRVSDASLGALRDLAMHRVQMFGQESRRASEGLRAVRADLAEQRIGLIRGAAALGDLEEMLGSDSLRLSQARAGAEAGSGLVSKGLVAADAASELAAAIGDPVRRLHELVSLLAEINFATQLLLRADAPDAPDACPLGQQPATIEPGNPQRSFSAVVREVRALILEIEVQASNAGRSAGSAAFSLTEAGKRLTEAGSWIAGAAVGVDRLQPRLAEARLGLRRAERLGSRATAMAGATGALAEALAASAQGLHRLFAGAVAGKRATGKPAASAASRPDLRIVGGRAFPDGV